MLLTRKIQRLGSSSLIITLPKTWVRRLGLLPGDNVYVIERDNQLILIPFVQGDVHGPPVIYNVEGKNKERVEEELRCLLENGLRNIIIEDKKGLDKGFLELVEEMASSHGGYTVEKVDNTRLRLKGAPLEIEAGQALRESMSRLADTIEVLTTIITGKGDVEGRPKTIEPSILSKITGWFFLNLDSVKGEVLEERRRVQPICIYGEAWRTLLAIQEEILSIIDEAKKKPIDDSLKNGLLRFIKTAENALWESIGGISNDSEKRIITALKLVDEALGLISKENIGENTPVPLWVGRLVGALTFSLRKMKELLEKESCHILFLGLKEKREE